MKHRFWQRFFELQNFQFEFEFFHKRLKSKVCVTYHSFNMSRQIIFYMCRLIGVTPWIFLSPQIMTIFFFQIINVMKLRISVRTIVLRKSRKFTDASQIDEKISAYIMMFCMICITLKCIQKENLCRQKWLHEVDLS